MHRYRSWRNLIRLSRLTARLTPESGRSSDAAMLNSFPYFAASKFLICSKSGTSEHLGAAKIMLAIASRNSAGHSLLSRKGWKKADQFIGGQTSFSYMFPRMPHNLTTIFIMLPSPSIMIWIEEHREETTLRPYQCNQPCMPLRYNHACQILVSKD